MLMAGWTKMDAAARTPDEEVLNTNVMGIEGPSHLRLLGELDDDDDEDEDDARYSDRSSSLMMRCSIVLGGWSRDRTWRARPRRTRPVACRPRRHARRLYPWTPAYCPPPFVPWTPA